MSISDGCIIQDFSSQQQEQQQTYIAWSNLFFHILDLDLRTKEGKFSIVSMSTITSTNHKQEWFI